MRKTAFLVINPITVDNFAFLFNCTPAVRTSGTFTLHKASNVVSGLMLYISLACLAVVQLVVFFNSSWLLMFEGLANNTFLCFIMIVI